MARDRNKKNRTPKQAGELAPQSEDAAVSNGNGHASPNQIIVSNVDDSGDYWKVREEYLKQRTALDEASKDGAKQHDTAILSVSSAALALSLGFLEKIAPNPIPETYPILGTAWLFLTASVAFVLLSFLTSQWACRRQIAILDEDHERVRDGIGGECDSRNNWCTVTNWLNASTYIALIVGVLLFVLFAYLNLP